MGHYLFLKMFNGVQKSVYLALCLQHFLLELMPLRV